MRKRRDGRGAVGESVLTRAFARVDGALACEGVPLSTIAQAVGNLLDNAIKYSGEARQITVQLRREDTAAVVAVSDRGIGIPGPEQGKIFERFHRVSTGLVHDVKGAGLGLSIVHHVVRAHHGHVLVDSEPGRGSTFSMYLPVAPLAEAPGSPASVEPAGDHV